MVWQYLRKRINIVIELVNLTLDKKKFDKRLSLKQQHTRSMPLSLSTGGDDAAMHDASSTTSSLLHSAVDMVVELSRLPVGDFSASCRKELMFKYFGK